MVKESVTSNECNGF